jgi:acetoin utilization protein AcuB
MLVRDHMTSNLTTLNDDARLLDAALLIRRTGRRHVPILSAETGKVVGIISDRDVLRLAPSVLSQHTEEEYNEVFERTPIQLAMTKSPITVRPDAPVIEAVQELFSKKISAVLVADDNGLQGIITVTDMLGLLNEMLGAKSADNMTASQG